MLPRITDLGLTSATEFVTRAGHPAFRGEQLFDWIHGRSVTDPDLMSNIPKALRTELRGAFDVRPVTVHFERDVGSDTEKALVRFSDKKSVESVLIMEGPRTTVCLSSQVGCPVACGFCASGLIVTPADYLATNPEPDEAAIRAMLSGNICRCTGYDGMVKAILAVAARQ